MSKLTIKIEGAPKSGKSELAEALAQLLGDAGLRVELKDTTRKHNTSSQLFEGLRARSVEVVVVDTTQ